MLLSQWLTRFSETLTRSHQSNGRRHQRRPQVQEVLRPSDLARRVDALEDRTLLAASLAQDFDTAGSNYSLIEPVTAGINGVTSGGPSGNYFRLNGTTSNSSKNGQPDLLLFDETLSLAGQGLHAQFDYRETIHTSGGSEGVRFTLYPADSINTTSDAYLTHVPPYSIDVGRGFPGVLHLHFDTFNNAQGSSDSNVAAREPNANHLEVNYNSNASGSGWLTSVTVPFDVNDAAWHTIDVSLVPNGQDGLLTVTGTSGGTIHTIIDSLDVPEFAFNADYRAALWVDYGAAISLHDIDNILIERAGNDNQVPTLNAIGNVSIDEDSSEQTVNLAGITAGGGESQPLRVTASSSGTGLIPNPTVTYTSANAAGSLAFTPVADQSGTATITVTVEDGGLDNNLSTAGDNATFSRTFDVTVNAVNDAPTLNAIGNVSINEDASEQTVNLAGITAGGSESQVLQVTATSSNTGLISNPTVTYTTANTTGSLAFTPVADQSGTATITVTVEDGGLDNNLSTAGDNATFSRYFTVSVEPEDFVENGRTLELRINDPNQTIAGAAVSDGYEFTLSSGAWTGNDSARVSGNGTSVLTVTADGRDFFDRITFDDFAANGSVQFVDSGGNAYTESMIVNLDRFDAGNIEFTGKSILIGNAELNASTTRQIVVSGQGTTVTTEDGKLVLSANQQTDRRTDLGTGVSISDAKVRVSGDADLVIRGTAGGTASVSDNTRIGVHIIDSVVFGGSGLVTVNGTGGNAGGNNNYGVLVYGLSDTETPSTITSSGGHVSVTGQGGGTGSSANNIGTLVSDGGLISSGGSGGVAVTGTGGTGSGNNNMGVVVRFSEGGLRSTITSLGGDVRIEGTGGGTGGSGWNRGVAIHPGGLVSAGGSGNVTVIGTSGGADGPYNLGVSVIGTTSPAEITSSGGNVLVRGTGNGSSASENNRGVEVLRGGVINAGNSGAVTIEGTGGNSGIGYEHGILVSGVSDAGDLATITSSGGHVSVTGQGGGTGSSAYNFGTLVTVGGLVSSGGSGLVTVNGTGGNSGIGYEHGILVSGVSDAGDPATITSSGGHVSVTGQGGGTGSSANNIGTLVSVGGLVSSGGSGGVAVTGTGGTGSGNDNMGVVVRFVDGGLRSTITSLGGDVRIEGTGGGTGASGWNRGVAIHLGGLVSAGGFGNVTVIGTSGGADGPYNLGVSVIGRTSPAEITSSGGNVLVRGTGNGSSASENNRGVEVLSGGVITAGNSGAVTIEGTGGNSGIGYEHGVLVSGMSDAGDPATITSSGGHVSVTGQGGGTGAASQNYGVSLSGGGRIGDPSTNHHVSIVATSGVAALDEKIGLRVTGTESSINAGTNKTISIDGQDGYSFTSVNQDLQAQTISFTDGTTLRFNLNGLEAENSFDQLDVGGTIDLTGTTLQLTGEYDFPTGGSVILVENDGGDAVIGTFDGVNENALITFGSTTLRLSYAGGDGNDVELTSINLPPTLDALSNASIAEDASEQTVNLAGITAGGGESQPLRVTASSSSTGLIPNPAVTYTSANAAGSIAFTPVADQSGTATITVTVEDGGLDGDLDTAGDNATFSRTFDVFVNATPTLNALSDLTIAEDASGQTVNLAGITAGGGESQPLRVTASSSSTGLIPNPTVTYTSANAAGSLKFAPVADQSGTATITVTVEDGGLDNDLGTAGDNATFSRTFDVTVNPVNDVPEITSPATFTVPEGFEGEFQIVVTDPDTGQTHLFGLMQNGPDHSQLTMNPNTGAWRFVTPPDFENPADSNTDNVYEVIAAVLDTELAAAAQMIQVTVTNVNEAPVFVSWPTLIPHGGTVVGPVVATDEDLPAQTVQYSIAGGADAGQFTIVAQTGVLSFTSARDHGNPTDADSDNVYEVIVEADDQAEGKSTQAVSVTVIPPFTFDAQSGALIVPVSGGSTAAVRSATVQR